VRTFDWDDFYRTWAGDAYIEFFRTDLSGSGASGTAGAADILLVWTAAPG
jgi:hypothetical protein